MALPTSQLPRGAARRRALLEAVVRVLGERGPAGVTHRAVAAEAGLPLAATTYYFESKEHMLGEALRSLTESEVAKLEAAAHRLDLTSASPDLLAREITTVLGAALTGSREVAAKFEVYLEASRRPELLPATSGWIATFVGLAEPIVGDAVRARLLVAAIDGLQLHQLATAGTLDFDALAPEIALLISALRR